MCPITQFEGKALVFNNGVVDVKQGDTSLVDENKVAHIPEGNVLIDNETIIKNANNQLEIPIDEDTIYIDEHGFMKAKGGNSEWSPIELSSEGGLYFKDGGLAIKAGDSLEIVDNKIEVVNPMPDFPEDSEGDYVLSFKNGVLAWVDNNEYFQWKLVDRALYLYRGKKAPGYTVYQLNAFAGLAPDEVKFDPMSPSKELPFAAGLFSGLDSFSLKVSLDVSKLEDLSQMFKNCSHLFQVDISSFKTAQVTNMDEMFYGCSALRFINVSDEYWSTESLEDSDNNMFYGCTNLEQWSGDTSANSASVGEYLKTGDLMPVLKSSAPVVNELYAIGNLENKVCGGENQMVYSADHYKSLYGDDLASYSLKDNYDDNEFPITDVKIQVLSGGSEGEYVIKLYDGWEGDYSNYLIERMNFTPGVHGETGDVTVIGGLDPDPEDYPDFNRDQAIWIFEPQNNGSYFLKNKHSNCYMSFAGGSQNIWLASLNEPGYSSADQIGMKFFRFTFDPHDE